MAQVISKYLHNVIDPVPSDDATGYCMQPSASTPNQKKFYWNWEEEIAKPKLKELGYTLIGEFSTGDGDSFGPLTRYIRVEKDGQKMELWYG